MAEEVNQRAVKVTNRAQVVPLQSPDILRFRLRKLTHEVANNISARTQMFNPQRTPEDIAEAIELLPMFLIAYLAVAWSIYIASAVPDEDAHIYSTRYLDLSVDSDSFLNVLASKVVEQKLLPDYRLGFMIAMLTDCHITEQMDAQKRLWREFLSQLSNLLASVSAHTELGVNVFEEFMKVRRTEEDA